MAKYQCPGSKSTVTQAMKDARKGDRFPCSYCGRYTKMHNLAGVLAAHSCDSAVIMDHKDAREARAEAIDKAKEQADKQIVLERFYTNWVVRDRAKCGILLAQFHIDSIGDPDQAEADAREYTERKRRIRAQELVLVGSK